MKEMQLFMGIRDIHYPFIAMGDRAEAVYNDVIKQSEMRKCLDR